ncbi:MAG: hypothetical protein HYW89_04725 [Candidatus Sungiibacteriota bacterium]|uniref:Uncharacterized protein n=1 Tax=Candidatus Sungiibacteriota bacterium TaxID=2750080 RepID=A0A7T5RKB0_9BACT|nr:MAG: hypothetical protein HYW89_04725 [Candidatus Sungbacteria bacterium]
MIYMGCLGEKRMWPNQNHPERKDDEVFLSNMAYHDFLKIRWQTKRCGQYPYANGKPVNVPGFSPVFVKKSEIQEFGLELPKVEEA